MTHLDRTLELLNQLSQLTLSNQMPTTVWELGELGADPEALAAQVHALVTEGQLHNQTSWAAHMTAPISPQSLFGQLLSSLHNGNLLSPELYPALAAIEQQVINWLCQLFKQQHGHFTAGGSYSNLEALWQAKQANNRSRIVYASTAAHYSINKACQLLDLDLRLIPCHDNDKMNADELRSACLSAAPAAIIATAGTPAAGAFDPLDDCILLAQRYQAWCHIDAAWGGYLCLLPEYNQLFGQYLTKADSLCFDPHKAWAQPKPASILLYQRPISPMMPVEAGYLQQPPSASLTGSRGGEAFLPLWYTIASLGIDALRQQSRLPLLEAQHFAAQLADKTTWPIYTSPTALVCFQTEKDLTQLVKLGVLSQAKRGHKAVYRVVFTSTLVSANALLTQLQPYF